MREILFLSGTDIESVGLSPADCIPLIRRTLEQHAEGLVEMPPKSGVHPPAGRHIHAMSAFLPQSGALGVKWIADFPRNPEKGLPTLSAVVILNDPETGVPLCIMDGASVTSMRTAAMTAVSLFACAIPDAKIAAVIGTGVQARAHAITLQIAFPGLRQIRVAGIDPDAALHFCRELDQPVLVPVGGREEAVNGADIVITVTNAVNAPLLEAEWLKPGVTVVVLDNGGKEIGILGFVHRIVADDRRPFDSEEVRHRFPSGMPQIDAEIGQILVGKAVGRQNNLERILVLNLGIAACDIVVAAEIYNRAKHLGLGKLIC